ncbi:recombinase family protein [Brevundimonas sp.]|uniref:recombinase family protein n=1 Tax=Brevundimonas sp. TaxID=1871086 RepID=UPI00263A1414|nr:recombinase family protein [Brevundimonas sp.]
MSHKPPFTRQIALPRRYVAYLRVSTSRQGDSGLGLEAQREAVTRYVEQVGGVLIDEVVEVESGKLRDRPGLLAALAHCRSKPATLVIARLDRLARNVAFVSSLMDGGVEFVAVDAPYANRLMLHILAAFAEHERDMVSARTKAALQAAKARGVKLGVNGARLAIARKTEAVAFAQKLAPAVEVAKAAGCTTLAQISDHLNACGWRTREGSAWCPATTRRMMARLAETPQPVM